MFSNLVKIIIRHGRRHKLLVLINMAGLLIGMACAIFILQYIAHQLSYDKHHRQHPQIYRVTQSYSYPNGYNHHFARCPDDWINRLPESFPVVEKLIRFQQHRFIDLKADDAKFRESRVFTVDHQVFEVFDFDFLSGNRQTALKAPGEAVLTESTARRYFGSVDVIGKELQLSATNPAEAKIYKISAVLRDPPATTHLKFNMLLSMDSPEARRGWAYVYLLLSKDSAPQQLQAQFPQFIETHSGEGDSDNIFLHLQNVADIHLHSNLARELEANGDIANIYVLAVVAALILLMACINFMNLATARSLSRAREVGIRKILGADRRQLIGYFLAESLFYSLLAFLGAVFLIHFLFPAMMSALELSDFATVSIFSNPRLLLIAIAIAIITGLLAGSYPALLLSGFRPLSMIRGGQVHGPRSIAGLRKLLVVFQLFISIALIACTLLALQQFHFISNRDLGLNTVQTIAIREIPGAVKERYPQFRAELEKHASIAGVSASMEVPSREIRDTGTIFAEGRHENDSAPVMDIQVVDTNFPEFMEMKLLAGSSFLPSHRPSQALPAGGNLQDMVNYVNRQRRVYLLNETAMRMAGWQEPQAAIGRQFAWSNSLFNLQRGPVIGIVKDFHQESLRNEIDPLVLTCEPLWLNTLLIRLHPENIAGALAFVEQRWDDFFPEFPFEYVFLDDLFGQLYAAEKRLSNLLAIFAALAVFIAFLGIFGLAAFAAEQRRREIGIRKVLGARVSNIVFILSRDYLVYVMLAGLLAVPPAWYAMQRWLESFAYRIDIGAGVFFLATVAALLVALATVGFQALRAALANPVSSLRQEN